MNRLERLTVTTVSSALLWVVGMVHTPLRLWICAVCGVGLVVKASNSRQGKMAGQYQKDLGIDTTRYAEDQVRARGGGRGGGRKGC